MLFKGNFVAPIVQREVGLRSALTEAPFSSQDLSVFLFTLDFKKSWHQNYSWKQLSPKPETFPEKQKTKTKHLWVWGCRTFQSEKVLP